MVRVLDDLHIGAVGRAARYLESRGDKRLLVLGIELVTMAMPFVNDRFAGWRERGNRGCVWLAVESLYSMDGDRAPLDDLAVIAARHDAVLLIDEAHATGVFGPNGRGLAAHLDGQDNVITLRTCGKALGCEGALVCAPAVVSDFLINRGRGMIFSTAPSPLMAAAAAAGRSTPDRSPAAPPP